jgi:hypothetical protein
MTRRRTKPPPTNLTRAQKAAILDRLAAVVESDLETDSLWEEAEAVGATTKKDVEAFVLQVAAHLTREAELLRQTAKESGN